MQSNGPFGFSFVGASIGGQQVTVTFGKVSVEDDSLRVKVLLETGSIVEYFKRLAIKPVHDKVTVDGGVVKSARQILHEDINQKIINQLHIYSLAELKQWQNAFQDAYLLLSDIPVDPNDKAKPPEISVVDILRVNGVIQRDDFTKLGKIFTAIIKYKVEAETDFRRISGIITNSRQSDAGKWQVESWKTLEKHLRKRIGHFIDVPKDQSLRTVLDDLPIVIEVRGYVGRLEAVRKDKQDKDAMAIPRDWLHL